MAKFCSNCGSELNNGKCPNCNSEDNNSKVTNQVENVNNFNEVNTSKQVKTNGFALAGFIISIVSPLLCCNSISWLGLIFSIIGLASVNKNNEKGKGLAIAGIIISVVTMIICAILVFAFNLIGYFSEIVNSELY